MLMRYDSYTRFFTIDCENIPGFIASQFAEPNLLREFLSRGIPRSRIIVTDKVSWLVKLQTLCFIVL